MRTKTKFYTVLLCMFLSISLLVTGAILAMPRRTVIAEDSANTVIVDETTYYTKVAQDAMPVYDLYAWTSDGGQVTGVPSGGLNLNSAKGIGIKYQNNAIMQFGFKATAGNQFAFAIGTWNYGGGFFLDFANDKVGITNYAPNKGLKNIDKSESYTLELNTQYYVRISSLHLYDAVPTSDTNCTTAVGEIRTISITDGTNKTTLTYTYTSSRPTSANTSESNWPYWGLHTDSTSSVAIFSSYRAGYAYKSATHDTVKDVAEFIPNLAGEKLVADADGEGWFLNSNDMANYTIRQKIKVSAQEGSEFVYATSTDKWSDAGKQSYLDLRFAYSESWNAFVARITPISDGTTVLRLMKGTGWTNTLKEIIISDFNINQEYILEYWRNDVVAHFEEENALRVGFRLLTLDGVEIAKLEELCYGSNYQAVSGNFWVFTQNSNNLLSLYSADKCKVTLNNGEESTTKVEVSNGYALPVLSNTQTKVFIGWKDANGNLLKADTLSGEFALGTGATYTFTAVWAEFYMTAGASIRVEADSGIRFTSIINSADLESLGNVTLGMRILRSTADGSTVEGGVDILADDEKLVETDGLLTFNGVVIGISDYTKLYEARSWLEITYANGTGSAEKVYAVASDNQRSIQQVATIILEKYNAGEITLSSSNLTLLEKMAGGVA